MPIPTCQCAVCHETVVKKQTVFFQGSRICKTHNSELNKIYSDEDAQYQMALQKYCDATMKCLKEVFHTQSDQSFKGCCLYVHNEWQIECSIVLAPFINTLLKKSVTRIYSDATVILEKMFNQFVEDYNIKEMTAALGYAKAKK